VRTDGVLEELIEDRPLFGTDRFRRASHG
jgi:hypothetical protein